jgi:sigma-B regulation protein RsbU (phosphoserine phosphatase)
MNDIRITIAAFDDPAPAEEVQGRLLAAWPLATLPTFEIVAAATFDPGAHADRDAVVIVPDSTADEPAILSLVSHLEEARIGALVLRYGPPETGRSYEYAGAVVHDRETDATVLAGALHGLAHRQRTVRELRDEAALADRFRGGIGGQMAKMHDELQLAAVVQREFLPQPLPPLHGVECAALWRPAHYVSGDLYDVIRLDEHHLGLFVADCIGHGVPAALMTMVVHRSLRVKETGESDYRLLEPCEVLARLNADLIRRQGPSTRFVTAVYAVLDCRSRRLTVAGGGHPAPILLGADGQTRLVETGGGLIGVFQDEEYDQQELTLAVDDRLLIYSDGFEQAFPDPQADIYRRRLPTTRFREEFEALRQRSGPTRMIEELARRLDDQRGSLHQADDLTLLCIHAGPVAASTAATTAAARTQSA